VLLAQMHVQNVLLIQVSYILLTILVWQLVLMDTMVMPMLEIQFVLNVTQLVNGVMVEP